jgi:hypothetical protein
MALSGFPRAQKPPPTTDADQAAMDIAVKRMVDGAVESAAGSVQAVKSVIKEAQANAALNHPQYSYSKMRFIDDNGRIRRRLTPWGE